MTIRVLLVDDHAIVRDGLRFLLGAEPNIDIVGDAADGREAVRLATQTGADVVIMDIAMPGLNGIEATQQMAQACPSARVIVLSMHSTSEHVFRALQVGAYGYLLKESAGSEIIQAVRSVYTGHRYLSQKISERVIDGYVDRSEGQTSPLDRLSSREREVLQLVVEGKSSAEIAGILYLSPKTVETYRSRLMHKLDITDLPALVKFAIQHGVTSLD